MIKLFTVIFIMSFSSYSHAEQKIHIYVEADEYGQHIDYNTKIGADWVKTDDGYMLSKKIAVSSLPYTSCIYKSCLTIREDGFVRFGLYLKEYEAGSEIYFFIPRRADGSFFNALEPYHFHLDGGQFENNLWTINADIKIVILDN